MAQKLHVLIVEDNERDAALLLRELQRGDYEVISMRVDTPEAMSAALEQRTWDVVISDFAMPRFSAPAALELVKAANLDMPFIIVSGTVGEEVAVDAMRAGAHDFMAKGRFSRLLPVVARELREAARRTEHRAVELKLRQAQKMEALGQLTGGIAHDFNNLLSVIVGNIELAMEGVQGNAALTDFLDAALGSAMHGSDLTRRLLAVARQLPLSTRVVNLNQRLPGIIAILQRTLGEGIHVRANLAKELWLVRIDPSQIEDAVLNLAINARDAMPEGGTISIETANVHLDEDYAAQAPEVTPGDYVLLSVTDTGTGMPPEIIERATEPFFTTKADGKGTGLGLSMIYGFVKQSGGHFSIYSQVGVGTTVRLYLPTTRNGESNGHGGSQTARDLPKGGETILIVEDNADLRRVAVRRLTGLGYKVFEADQGSAALELLDSGQRFDLLFTDVGLPNGLTGFQLADLACQRQPWLKVLFTTGYAKVEAQNNGRIPDARHLILKPYLGEDLARKIRGAIDEPRDEPR